MTGWIVLGAVLLALFLLSLVRAGGSAEYSGAGVLVKVRLGVLRFTVYPRKPKQVKDKRKKKKEKTEKKAAQEEEPEGKPGGSFDLLKRFLPPIADAAGQFKRKVRVDRLYLDLTAAAADPAAAALAFGGANAAIGMIWPVLENNFDIRERRVRTQVDFTRKTPAVYVYAAFSLTLGQGIVLGIKLLARFWKIYAAWKRQQNEEQKEAV